MMRILRCVFLFAILALAPALPALPQAAPATLVADRIDFDPERLVASGGVEIFADGRILRASRITYIRAENRLEVEGPMTLVDGDDAVLIADLASLSPDLQGSVLSGARLVLDDRLQVAATEIAQGTEGRYTQLYQAVASSCQVCASRPTPLWQIRAKRIVHDRQERQLHFENPRFEVVGVPVFWLPRLRLPDPTVDRMTGFLTPSFSSDGLLGTGVTVPYFIALGPSRDLLVAPFVTNTATRSLGFRYRQAFDNGSIQVDGAVSSDDIVADDGLRGYLFANGAFALPRDYRLEFDIEAVSDNSYLVNYGVTGKDRLDSRVAITRVERERRFLAEATLLKSLRSADDNDFLPTRIVTVERQGRTEPRFLGGQAIWTLQAHARERTANVVPLGRPANSARDVLRASAAVDWRRSWVADGGLVWTGLAGLHVDAYNVRQDVTFSDSVFVRAVPYAGVEARLPMARGGSGGVRHVIEPVAQVIFAPNDRAITPDEDSLTPEFDEGNLFSASRFAGRDTRELGTRLNVGIGYTRHSASGWNAGVLVGRVLRAEDLGQFRDGSGLGGEASDWLLSIGMDHPDGFEVMQRALFDNELTVSRSETILRWSGASHSFLTRYTYLEADPTAGRPIDTAEWAVDASLDLVDDWTGRVNWRYDFRTDDASSAGLGLTYRSECVTANFDVERRYTSNVNLKPTTRFGLSVELAGFGADDRARRARKCGI